MKAARGLLPLLALAALACGDESKGGAAITTPSPHIAGVEDNLTAISGPSLSKQPTRPAVPHQVTNEDAPMEFPGSPGTTRTPRSVDHDLLEEARTQTQAHAAR